MRRPGTGRRTDPRSLYSRAAPAANPFAALFQGSGVNRDWQFTADSYTTGPLLFVDQQDPTHTMSVIAGTLATPAPRAALNGKNAANFTGSQCCKSNRSLAANKFFHDGTGMTVCLVWEPTLATNQNMLSTTNVATGFDMLYLGAATGAAFSRVQNGVGAVFQNSVPSQIVVNTPLYLTQTYSEAASPKQVLRNKSTVIANTAPALAPTASNPTNALVLFGDNVGSALARGYWRALYCFHRVLNAGELLTLQAFIQSDVGIAP